MPSDCYRVYYTCTEFGVYSSYQAFFLLEHKQTDRQRQLKAVPTPAAMSAWVNIGKHTIQLLYKLRRLNKSETNQNGTTNKPL